MDTALSHGDFAGDRPYLISGTDELLQRAYIRLQCPLGGFSFDPTLGSRLHEIVGIGPEADRLALSYAQDALRELPAVDAVSAHVDAEEVVITVQCSGASYAVSVAL